MPNERIYIKNVSIEGASAVVDDFHYYNGTIQTMSLNERHFFRCSLETLRSIQKQANDGVELLDSHSHYKPALGRSTSAKLYGKKVSSTFFILANVEDSKSNDHIKRLDAGITRALSTGFSFTDDSKLISDIDGSEMERKFSWFNVYYEDESGNILGAKLKDGTRVTAELKGPVKLWEYSIVGIGADPGAKVRKKIKENLENGLFDEGNLEFYAESFNLEYSSFVNSLGYESNKSIFDLGGDPPVNDKTNPELLLKENERLEQELDDVTKERDKLKQENETLKESATEHTDADFLKLSNEKKELEQKLEVALSEADPEAITALEYTELETEKTELETKLKTANTELETAKAVISTTETLQDTLKENYKALYISLYYDSVESDLANAEIKSQMKDLDVLELYNSVASMRRSLAKKRAKGRQSATSELPEKTTNRIPAHINEIGM